MAAERYEDAIVREHRGLVWKIAGRYYLPGGSREDLVQEGFVGLLQAARGHDEARGPFSRFAALCIERRIQDAVRSAQRVRGGEGDDVLALVPDDRLDVPTLAMQRATLYSYAAVILSGLTPVEREALRLVVNGEPYAFSRRLDNAAQSARRKLRMAA